MQNMSVKNSYFCFVACAKRLPAGLLALIRCREHGLGLRCVNRFQAGNL
jgi:hypothetical protein